MQLHVSPSFQTTVGVINKFSRSSNSLTLPKVLHLLSACTYYTHTHTHNLPAHTDTHTIYLLDRQTDPPTFPSRASVQLSRLWQSCFSMQHVWVSWGEWKWVKAFRKRPQHRSRSYSAVLAFHSHTHTHTSCKPLTGQSHTRGGYIQEWS